MALNYEDTDNIEKVIIDNENIWDLLYPIGSIFWTTIEGHPDNIFNNGRVPKSVKDRWQWVKIEGFLYSKPDSKNDSNFNKAMNGLYGSDNLTVGKYYEYKPPKLTSNNLPAHTHSMDHTHSRGTMNITGTIGEHNEWHCYDMSSGAFTKYISNFHDGYKGSGTDGYATYNFDASRSWTGNTSGPSNGNTGSSGSGNPDPVFNLPPITVAYCWKRIGDKY